MRYVPSNGPRAVEGDGVCAFAAASRPKIAASPSEAIHLLISIPIPY
jgi:hypothetical protein